MQIFNPLSPGDVYIRPNAIIRENAPIVFFDCLESDFDVY